MTQTPHDPNQPQFANPQQHTVPKPPKKHRARNVGIIAAAGLVGVVILAAAFADPAAEAPTSVTTRSTTPVDNGPTPDPVTTPTNKPVKPSASASPAAPKTTQPPVPKPKPVVYKKLTARQWAKIAKSPDSHRGETYIVYGKVTQFDSATGDDQFRADVDGVKHKVEYGYVDYPTNTLMTNISGDVSDLVEDDLFTAKVAVVGAYSYDTQIGGETTVPQLSVMSISVTGSVK